MDLFTGGGFPAAMRKVLGAEGVDMLDDIAMLGVDVVADVL